MTFCGALIVRKDYESFNWVFNRFLHAMGEEGTRIHNYRSGPGSDYSDFMGKVNEIIWGEELEAAEFDAIWDQIIEAHGLGANDWFADTYADIVVSILFESSMDQQRHTQKQLDNNDKHSYPKTSTHPALESHGVKVYTNSAFNTFKEEAIYSIDTYRTGGFTQRDELEVTTVKDSSRGKNFEVAYSPALTDDPGKRKASCNCTMFERTGILCRHIIWIFSANGMKIIPDDYVIKRWTKECLRLRMFNCNGEGTDNMEIMDGK
ncbi:protein FAR1-RELATED SEQUENCE 9-like [Silene latifolia]|uniref:protein FAR1-RELATED SEQUENCE 9-like n=1 Tax=Silene latifolia TaxID=37657 RepID=UPI003D78AFC8